jgi:hypothetical protein
VVSAAADSRARDPLPYATALTADCYQLGVRPGTCGGSGRDFGWMT